MQICTIIVLVRDIFDVFASYLKWADKEPTSYLNEGSKTVKEKIEFLMHKDGLISQSLLGTNTLYNHHHDNTMFVHYKEFAINPKEQIERVYRFLNLELFEHDFNNVNQFKVNNVEYQDEVYGHNMHTIKSQIVYDDTEIQKYKEIIPKEIYAQYHDTNIWLTGIR